MELKDNLTVQIGNREDRISHLKDIIKSGKFDRVFILDTHNDFSEYPLLKDDEFFNDTSKKGIYRVIIFTDIFEVRQKRYLEEMFKFKNGLLVLVNPYFLFDGSKVLPNDFIGKVSTLRTFKVTAIIGFDKMIYFEKNLKLNHNVENVSFYNGLTLQQINDLNYYKKKYDLWFSSFMFFDIEKGIGKAKS